MEIEKSNECDNIDLLDHNIKADEALLLSNILTILLHI